MADEIRIKDLQSTASYMESDDFIGIDSLASGTRKINFAGLMDSEDDRLPTTDKTPRGAIDEHEGDISEIKQSLSDYFTKSYTITASSERAFIKDLATQAYAYMLSKSLPFMLVNASWEGNNTGYMIISSTRRFQVQVGDSMSLGILNAAGTDLAQLRSVTTTAHP